MDISIKEQHTMMEEDGDGEEEALTPFWLQSTAHLRRGDRLRRGFSSLFSSGLMVFLLLVTAVVFLAFVLPSTLSFSAHNFKPTTVKKSWDSLNVVLVLAAVLFGFLSRNKNEERYGYYDDFQQIPSKENEAQKTSSTKWDNYQTDGRQKSNLVNSREWYEYTDVQDGLERKNSFLRRNSSSYPDLREFSAVDLDYGDHRRRFYNDFYARPGKIPDQDAGRTHRRHRSLEQFETLTQPPLPPTKTVTVDTWVSKSIEAVNSPPPPLTVPTKTDTVDTWVSKSIEAVNPPPPPLAVPTAALPVAEPSQPKGKTRKERSKRKPSKDLEPENFSADSTLSPPAPRREKSSKSDRKRVGATGSATKDFLNSLNHKRTKKQRQKSVDNLGSLLHEARPPLSFHLHPPPQSPPPSSLSPPPSVLQNLFSSEKQKRKKIIKVTLAPNLKSQIAQSATHNPPKPIKLRTVEKLEENSNSGGESPFNRRIPPPPPPPPAFFKNPAWKFVVQGDYVRVNSTGSSRSGSPNPDELDSDVTPSSVDGGHVTPFHPSPLFCASPDVNSKAESFITNFRAKLKLEKIYSMKKRNPGLSSLGPRRI